MSYYRRVAVKTYSNLGEASSKGVRAQPLPGQGFPINMHVECSAKMRENHPVGTVFIVQARLKEKEGGMPFLYTSWQWAYEVIDEELALRRIADGAL